MQYLPQDGPGLDQDRNEEASGVLVLGQHPHAPLQLQGLGRLLGRREEARDHPAGGRNKKKDK